MRDDAWLERVTEVLREPVRLDSSFDARVLAEIDSQPPVDLAWRHRPTARPLLWSPVGAVALAAAVLAGILVGRSWLAPPADTATALTAAVASAQTPTVQFVIVAPEASTVALVGDFNDWSHTATPMRRAPGDAVWSVTIPLTEGRYRYAFLVDGARWLVDPSAPRAIDDDFGPPNSVVTVGAL